MVGAAVLLVLEFEGDEEVVGGRLDLEDQARLAYGIGALELAVGDRDAARTWLTRAVALREGSDAPGSPWLVEARTTLARANAP